ncbi:AraC family transcriptional regulator ligand-binding domain-containing protein [Thalassotalea ganghwensis]
MALPLTLMVDDKFFPAHQLAACLIDLVCSRGVDQDKLLRGTGIFYQDIRHGNVLLSAKQLLKLIERAERLYPGNDCAFLLGHRLFPSNYGAITSALQYSQHLAEALRILSVFHWQICPFIFAKRYDDQQRVNLLLNDSFGSDRVWRFIIETYCTALSGAIKRMFGNRIPLRFYFAFPQPSHLPEYQENLGSQIEFSMPVTSISFDKKHLHSENPLYSRTLKWCAIKEVKAAERYCSLIEALHRLINRHSHCSLQEAAQYFLLSPSTLKRKLSLHGTSFQQIQDQVRSQQAIYWLNMQRLNNEESALRMCFSDLANFRRSVKRWTGLTPSELRAKR